MDQKGAQEDAKGSSDTIDLTQESDEAGSPHPPATTDSNIGPRVPLQPILSDLMNDTDNQARTPTQAQSPPHTASTNFTNIPFPPASFPGCVAPWLGYYPVRWPMPQSQPSGSTGMLPGIPGSPGAPVATSPLPPPVSAFFHYRPASPTHQQPCAPCACPPQTSSLPTRAQNPSPTSPRPPILPVLPYIAFTAPYPPITPAMSFLPSPGHAPAPAPHPEEAGEKLQLDQQPHAGIGMPREYPRPPQVPAAHADIHEAHADQHTTPQPYGMVAGRTRVQPPRQRAAGTSTNNANGTNNTNGIIKSNSMGCGMQRKERAAAQIATLWLAANFDKETKKKEVASQALAAKRSLVAGINRSISSSTRSAGAHKSAAAEAAAKIKAKAAAATIKAKEAARAAADKARAKAAAERMKAKEAAAKVKAREAAAKLRAKAAAAKATAKAKAAAAAAAAKRRAVSKGASIKGTNKGASSKGTSNATNMIASRTGSTARPLPRTAAAAPAHTAAHTSGRPSSQPTAACTTAGRPTTAAAAAAGSARPLQISGMPRDGSGISTNGWLVTTDTAAAVVAAALAAAAAATGNAGHAPTANASTSTCAGAGAGPSTCSVRPTKRARKEGGERRTNPHGWTVSWRARPSEAVLERIERALGEGWGSAHRLYLLDTSHVRPPGAEGGACQEFTVMGATGNVYTVTVGCHPHCTCPDYAKGHICKHLLFVYLRVLGRSRDDPLIWQAALISSEADAVLRGIAGADQAVDHAALASEAIRRRYRQMVEGAAGRQQGQSTSYTSAGPHRQPVEGDCPICYEPLAPAGSGPWSPPPQPLEWCSRCGNNLHKECFSRWSDSRRKINHRVTCVYCRAEWVPGGGSAAAPTAPHHSTAVHPAAVPPHSSTAAVPHSTGAAWASEPSGPWGLPQALPPYLGGAAGAAGAGVSFVPHVPPVPHSPAPAPAPVPASAPAPAPAIAAAGGHDYLKLLQGDASGSGGGSGPGQQVPDLYELYGDRVRWFGVGSGGGRRWGRRQRLGRGR